MNNGNNGNVNVGFSFSKNVRQKNNKYFQEELQNSYKNEESVEDTKFANIP